MAPTDDLDVDAQPDEPGSEPGTPEPSKAAGGPPPITAEQVEALVSKAMNEGNQSVLEAVRSLQGALEAQRPAQPAVEPGDLAERLLTDPDKVFEEKQSAWAKQTLAPMLSRAFEVERDERIETQASELDQDYGDGFFDEHIRPRLVGEKGCLSAYPINQQADPMVINAAIAGILGNMERDPEMRTMKNEALHKTTKARQERDVSSPPHMMGPGRPRPKQTDKLSPEMLDALEGFQRAGIKITEQDLKTALGRSPSASEWLPKESRP